MGIAASTVLSAKPGALYASLDADTGVLFSAETGAYYELNAVGSRIWELVSERARSLVELRDQLLLEFEVDGERCERAVVSFAADIVAEGLAEVDEISAATL